MRVFGNSEEQHGHLVLVVPNLLLYKTIDGGKRE
jgi:hypothetical protein